MLSLPEAARNLGISPSTLRLQVKLGKIRATKLSRDWFISDEEVERYRAEHLRPKDGAQ